MSRDTECRVIEPCQHIRHPERCFYCLRVEVERLREVIGDLAAKSGAAAEVVRLYNRNGASWRELDAALARMESAVNRAADDAA